MFLLLCCAALVGEGVCCVATAGYPRNRRPALADLLLGTQLANLEMLHLANLPTTCNPTGCTAIAKASGFRMEMQFFPWAGHSNALGRANDMSR